MLVLDLLEMIDYVHKNDRVYDTIAVLKVSIIKIYMEKIDCCYS